MVRRESLASKFYSTKAVRLTPYSLVLSIEQWGHLEMWAPSELDAAIVSSKGKATQDSASEATE